jgi:hypothetical protein
MKRFFTAIFFLCVFSTALFAQNRTLPVECRKILDKNFRGWKFKKISVDIKKYLQKYDSKKADGNFISGDWNGDGKKDFAVLITHGSETLNDGMKLPRDVSVAFVRDDKSYKYFVLDTSGDYISLDKKGTTAYDHETQSGIKFVNDAVFVGIWEKSGRSYVWQKNKFIYFITSD